GQGGGPRRPDYRRGGRDVVQRHLHERRADGVSNLSASVPDDDLVRQDRPAALLRRRGLQGIFTRDTAASVSGLRSTIAPSVVGPLGVPTTIAVVAVALQPICGARRLRCATVIVRLFGDALAALCAGSLTQGRVRLRLPSCHAQMRTCRYRS